MIHALLFVLMAGTSPANVELAQELYERAKYDEAAAALGESCSTALEQVRCEAVRASILVATGKRDMAMVAYTRALLLEPKFKLPPRSSPKLTELVAEARQLVAKVLNIELEGVSSDASDTRWLLAIGESASHNSVSRLRVERITVYFGAPGSRDFVPVILTTVDEGWQGTVAIASEHQSGVGAYYYSVTLSNGAELHIGNEASYRRVRVRRSFDSGQYGALTKPWPRWGEEEDEIDDSEEVPTWVWVVTASSIAAIVVGAVVVGTIILEDRQRVKEVDGPQPQLQPLLHW